MRGLHGYVVRAGQRAPRPVDYATTVGALRRQASAGVHDRDVDAFAAQLAREISRAIRAGYDYRCVTVSVYVAQP